MVDFPQFASSSQVAYTTGTSFSAPIPAGTQIGDLLLFAAANRIIDTAANERIVNYGGQNGWALLGLLGRSNFGNGIELTAAWKIATGNDSLTISTGGDNVGSINLFVARFTGGKSVTGTFLSTNDDADTTPHTHTYTSNKVMWVALGSATNQGYTGAPANYSNYVGHISPSTHAFGFATRQLEATTEQPGPFGGPIFGAQYVVATLAIEPTGGVRRRAAAFMAG